MNLEELENILKKWGEPPFHAKQIFSWIYKRGASDFLAMSDLSSQLRKRLKENFYLFRLILVKVLKSKDGTQKLVFKLNDVNFIETVMIPSKERVTACLSTQLGCKFACKFCASGSLGFVRNLTRGEIIEEILYLKNSYRNKKITHVVFMGIGEPLDNYDNVIKAIRIINSSDGLNIGARRITISTCGIIPAIKRLAEEGLQIELSISLHAADSNRRSQIMPINKKYSLVELIKTCREYIKKTNRQITFEYVLIKGINSDLQIAKKLSIMLKGLNCKVNLIMANPVKELNLEPPKNKETLLFRDYLLKSGINVTLRKPRGQDIHAACGQLRLRYVKK